MGIVLTAVFDHFKDANGHFFGSTSQFNRDVASMLSLYRASQLAFPGESILDEARDFATKYLREALQKREIFTAWNNKQNLSHEVNYCPYMWTRLFVFSTEEAIGRVSNILFTMVRFSMSWTILGM